MREKPRRDREERCRAREPPDRGRGAATRPAAPTSAAATSVAARVAIMASSAAPRLRTQGRLADQGPAIVRVVRWPTSPHRRSATRAPLREHDENRRLTSAVKTHFRRLESAVESGDAAAARRGAPRALLADRPRGRAPARCIATRRPKEGARGPHPRRAQRPGLTPPAPHGERDARRPPPPDSRRRRASTIRGRRRRRSPPEARRGSFHPPSGRACLRRVRMHSEVPSTSLAGRPASSCARAALRHAGALRPGRSAP